MSEDLLLHRAAFEVFYSKELECSKYSETFTRNEHRYEIGHVQRAWLAWCSGARHQKSISPTHPDRSLIMKWERLDECHTRARIPGGWLVKAYEEVYTDMRKYEHRPDVGYEWRMSMCFVPDPLHEWEIDQ